MDGRVCVIGAGVSGICAVKALSEAGVAFDCFERGSDIGGLWRYGGDSGHSAAYRGLHINTSRKMMQFSDAPMPETWPQYPHHSQVWRYFSDYCDRFGLRQAITFGTEVESVVPLDDGRDGYRVTVREVATDVRQTREYTAVVVCNGHHWLPRVPSLPGHFDGECLHAVDYDVPEAFEGRRVVVVGIGNSGVDIAAETSHVTEHTVLSTRRGAWVLPRFMFGRPTDHFDTPAGARAPLWLRRRVYHLLLRLTVGDQEAYGIPRPEHPLLAEHPTMSSALLERAAHGEVTVKPDIAELAGDRVHFVDGSEERADVLILATGYRIAFPFLDPQVLAAPDNDVALYRRVVDPDHPGLYFIGLFQVTGAMMPIAQLQAQWVAALISGRAQLPPPAHMRRHIDADRRALRRRYTHSARHTIQVDYWPYIDELRGLLRQTTDRPAPDDAVTRPPRRRAGARPRVDA